MAYCTHELGNKESTIGGKLVAVSLYHQQCWGIKLPLGNVFLKGVRKGIKRKQVEEGVQQKIRRPLSWGIITEMQGEAAEWGEGGRVLWIGFALSYLLMMRASELFTGEGGRANGAFILTRGDVAFFNGDQQMMGEGRRGADKIEVRFTASKGDQDRKGAILVRVKGGRGAERDEGAVGLLAELFESYEGEGLTTKAPLMTFKEGERWRVWGRDKATKCLRRGLGGSERGGRKRGGGQEPGWCRSTSHCTLAGSAG